MLGPPKEDMAMPDHSRNEFSRRLFLKTASTGLLAALSSSALLQACTFPSREAASSVALWYAINFERRKFNSRLPWIPISAKLTKVAQAHIKDLATYKPHNACGGNLHAWSKNGPWKKYGCIDQDPHVMWDKPSEIAGYTNQGETTCFHPNNAGFEVSHSGSSAPRDIVASWIKSKKGHKEVLFSLNDTQNENDWSCATWRALGAAYGNGYACAWFGETADL
jgi:hypothetical protein